MRIISPKNFVTMPWKNGGGITREILKQDNAGQMIWRLSMAEVKSDGPFSVFEGMMRILTVIEGKGLRLASPQKTIVAEPLSPVTFSGETAINGERISDDVVDVNVIFDDAVVSASVNVLRAVTKQVSPDPEDVLNAVFTLDRAQINGLSISPRSFCQSEGEVLDCQSSGPLLHIVIKKLPHAVIA